MIEKMIREKVNDVTTTNGLMHLLGLITHIRQMTDQLVAKDTSQSAIAVRFLVNCFVSFAGYYYAAFSKSLDEDDKIKTDPRKKTYRQHQAIERLCSDWEILTPLLYAIKDPRVRLLEALVHEAEPNENYWKQEWEAWSWGKIVQQGWLRPLQPHGEDWNVEWEKWIQKTWKETSWQSRIITLPYFGRRFELVKFIYAPYVFVTSVPLYNLETPWDWPVVWHEMAGHVVRQLEETDGINRRIIPALPDDILEMWQKMYAKPTLDDPTADSLWDNVELADWIAELFEDQYSVLSLGPAMVTTMARVLRQHYEDDYTLEDMRHPPIRLRLDMAGATLLEMGIAQEDLKELELDIKNCQNLRSTAGALCLVSTRSEGYAGYVSRVFNPNLITLSNKLKDRLLAGKEIPDRELNIPALIAAARMAFEEQPDKGRHIAETLQATVKSIANTVQDPVELPPLPDEYFKKLVEGKTWEDLLEEPFHSIDHATPSGHNHKKSNRVCLVFSAHGKTHAMWTSKKHHRKKCP